MAKEVSWPGWDVGACIGKGGHGAVYELRREVFGDVERSALKVIRVPTDPGEIEYLRCEGMDDESISNTFYSKVGDIVKEYKLMRKFRDNPNIVHCDEFRYTRHEDDLGWDVLIKMELLTPLTKALDRVSDEKQIIALGMDMCNALIACQEAKIIHRDIKPQNIFLAPSGAFKLGDFGIARTMEHTTRATVGIGTYSFMAPEVARGDAYGPTVDIYSLGLVMYWLLNEKRHPFLPQPPAAITYAMNDEARIRRYKGEKLPPPKNGSEELKRIVLKACSFNPRNRYASAKAMMEALQQAGSPKTKRNGFKSGGGKPNEEPVKEKEPPKQEAPADETKTTNAREPGRQGPTNAGGAQPPKGDPPRGANKMRLNIAAVCIIAAILLCPYFVHRANNLVTSVSDDESSTLTSQANTAESEANEANTADNAGTAKTVSETAWKSNVMKSDPYNVSDTTSDDFIFGSGVSRGEIISISFLDTMEEMPEDAWDISAASNGSVMAWAESSGDYYDLFIAGDGGVCAPTSCEYLFYSYGNLKAIRFNGNFHTDRVTDMSNMFADCSSLTELDVSGFDTSKVTDMYGMFGFCSSLIELDVSGFDTSKVADMSFMFYDCSNLTELDISSFDTSEVTDMEGMFGFCSGLKELDVSGFDTSKVTNMSFMFADCSGLTELDVSGFDTSKVTDMNWMFHGCSNLTELDVSNFDTAQLTDMYGMFGSCSGLKELDVSGFDTSKVTDMSWMFYNCSNLTELNVSNFDTSQVTDMSGMFGACSNLKALAVGKFDTSKVTNMERMFYGCSNLRGLDVKDFDTSNVTSMAYMYDGCTMLSILNVSNFDTSKVTDMRYMFYGCSNLTGLDVSNFDTSNVQNYANFMDGTGWEFLFT